MSLSTILLITLAALFALGFVFFKYFTGTKTWNKRSYALAFFRFISLFLLLLLLINPEIRTIEYEVEKPELLIAQDLSGSIDHLEKKDSVIAFVNFLKEHPELQEVFNIKTYGFGQIIKPVDPDTVTFSETQTNITSAIQDLSQLKGEGQTALVIITDGNQTLGEDYQYFQPPNNFDLFPVIAGDTTATVDLYINELNVNKYAFLDNNFPVEVFVNYSGSEAVRSNFEIRSGETVLFSTTLDFNEEKTSNVIVPTLPANRLGVITYEAEISPLEGEKNNINNIQRFGVEVIDESTKVLIVSSVLHPDLGMFKKSIEANEQREAEIILLKNLDKVDIADFQLLILYQPNNGFSNLISDLREKNINSLLVTGSKTDWNFVNSVMPFSRDYIPQQQEYIPVYNLNYSAFQFDDIGFAEFPPLVDVFGALNFSNKDFDALLFQQVEGLPTTSPLLATYEEGASKKAVLFGENIWKWRAQSFLEENSFQAFDDFFGRLVQYLASTQKRDRLTVDAETFFAENEEVVISAQYFDENFQFNPNGQLQIVIVNSETASQLQAQMLMDGNRFIFSTDNLEAGQYEFTIRENSSGVTKSGSFAVLEYNVEQQFSSANISKMQNLANSVGSEVYFLDKAENLVANLLKDNRYVALQKSHEKDVPLISWKVLLFLLILSLSAEWFTRKYFGLI